MLLLVLALLYFVITTAWLIHRRRWKQAVLTMIVALALVGAVFLAMNLEMVDGRLQWIAPQQ